MFYTQTIDITVQGVDFEVEFYATDGRGGTHWEPPEPAELEIQCIKICDQDVTEILHAKVHERIVEKVWDEINERKYDNDY